MHQWGFLSSLRIFFRKWCSHRSNLSARVCLLQGLAWDHAPYSQFAETFLSLLDLRSLSIGCQVGDLGHSYHCRSWRCPSIWHSHGYSLPGLKMHRLGQLHLPNYLWCLGLCSRRVDYSGCHSQPCRLVQLLLPNLDSAAMDSSVALTQATCGSSAGGQR